MFVWYFKEENTLRFWRLCGTVEGIGGQPVCRHGAAYRLGTGRKTSCGGSAEQHWKPSFAYIVTTRTEKKKNQPTHVLVDSNPAFEEPSMILLEQIFTIDKSRMQVMRSCGPHPSFSHSAFNAAAVSASMPSFRRRAGYQRVELSLCALARGVGACRLHSDGRSCRCGRNCLRRLLYGARLWPRCRNVITRYNTFASVICKVQWTLRSLSEGGVSCGKTTIKKLDKLQITCAVRTAYERMKYGR